MDSPASRRRRRVGRLRRAASVSAGVFAAASVALVLASGAAAGTYTALACTKGAAAPTLETAAFETTSPAGWRGQNSCGADHLYILPNGTPTPAYSSARWVISAPSGLRFIGGYFWAYAKAGTTEHRPRYLYRVAGSTDLTEVGPIVDSQEQPTWHTWLEPNVDHIAADQLIIEQRCTAASGCGDGWGGAVYAYDFGFRIEDVAQPTVASLAGPLMEGPAQRGTQLLNVAASDQGGGVQRIEVWANGVRIAVREPGCAVDSAGNALRLSPCPAEAAVDFAVDTTKPPFREGKNALEVCVADYARESEDPASFAEESCSPAGAYVDNSCDVSDGPDAADIRFGFGRRGNERRTVRFGTPARVLGKLTDAADEPIEGATICVSSRDRLGAAAAIDIAETQTNRHGKADVKLPDGASRRVKLTYWADEEAVQMQTVGLSVRARPKLRVLSKRHLSDGGKARFRTKLAGPYRGHRKVAIQALAPAGWLDFPGCTGRTNRKGYFRCSYGFREQSGDVKYKFRALVPRQRGYPYLQGRTRSKTVLVRD